MRPLLSIVLFIISLPTWAHDTLRVSLRQADSLFLVRNYQLLANSMHIKAQRALEIQAQLYPNPIVTADINVYDPENKKAFHTGTTGQKFFQIEQLIVLGGKRKAAIDLAKTETQLAEYEFQDLVRELKYRLHAGLYSIGQQKQLLERYNVQLALLDSLLSSTQTQVAKGNIPVKDLVRLKGAYLKLNNDRAELLKEYYATQSVLNMILQSNATIDFTFEDSDIQRYIRPEKLATLQELALQHRPDWLWGKTNQELAEKYWLLQKKTAIPDMTVFANYDQRSGAFTNQISAGISIPLPLWNKNQGNIKAAKYRIEQTSYQLEGIRNQIQTELANSYYFYQQTINEYQKVQELYDPSFEVTLQGMTTNFKKRNISIVEFVDFFEAYNEMLSELVRIKIQLVTSGEELNRLIGKDIY